MDDIFEALNDMMPEKDKSPKNCNQCVWAYESMVSEYCTRTGSNIFNGRERLPDCPITAKEKQGGE